MFDKIPGDIWKDSGESSRIFRRNKEDSGKQGKKTISSFSEVAIFYTNAYK